MVLRKRDWGKADAATIQFWGLSVDENGDAYDYEIVYTEEEQAQIRRAQAIEAARETPDFVKANLGIL